MSAAGRSLYFIVSRYLFLYRVFVFFIISVFGKCDHVQLSLRFPSISRVFYAMFVAFATAGYTKL